MIQSVNNKNIKECVDVIKESFLTVANEFGFTIENAPRFTAFATTEQRLSWQLNNEKRPMYAFIVDGKIVGYYSLALQDNKECELNNLCVLLVFSADLCYNGVYRRAGACSRRDERFMPMRRRE